MLNKKNVCNKLCFDLVPLAEGDTRSIFKHNKMG